MPRALPSFPKSQPDSQPESQPDRLPPGAHRRERQAQLRGLLWLALAVLLFLLWRAKPLLLFHPGWWRL